MHAKNKLLLAWLALVLVEGMGATLQAEQPEGEENLDQLLEEEFSLIEDSAKVVESAARHQQELGMSPSAVTVITRKDIETSGAQRMVDLLRLVPGMDVILATPAFSAVGLRTPWTHKNCYVLVLIDGRETTVDFFGTPILEMLPISIDDIDRIEVLKGPGSALYGANAYAGVVSIFTRRAEEKNAARVFLGGGDDGQLVAAGKLSARIEPFLVFATAETDRVGDFMDRSATGKDSLRLRAAGEWRVSNRGRVLLDASLAQGEGPVPTNIGTFDGQLRIASVRLAFESESLKSHLYWNNYRASSDFGMPLSYNKILLARVEKLEGRGNIVDGEVQWRLPTLWQPLLIIAGAGSRLITISSPQLLDAKKFSDPNSDGYHRAGMFHIEGRGAPFCTQSLSRPTG